MLPGSEFPGRRRIQTVALGCSWSWSAGCSCTWDKNYRDRRTPVLVESAPKSMARFHGECPALETLEDSEAGHHFGALPINYDPLISLFWITRMNHTRCTVSFKEEKQWVRFSRFFQLNTCVMFHSFSPTYASGIYSFLNFFYFWIFDTYVA